ncbi:MAG: OmpH family outer membrane protein [Trueperaceae bacterium]|nr:OmpH family outer membrane protein [Trueperaceae bacterium]
MRTHTTRAFALILIALSALATAQEADPAAPFRIAFVDTQALIAAHPAQAEIARMGEALDAELQELLGQREALLQKQQAQALTPEEQELLQALQVTIQTRRDSGLRDIREAAGPAETAANEIIREIARGDGYALVLDIEAASGLVVFAAEDVPDITSAAVALMEERFPAE